jgi:hypothetical protein
MYKMTCDSKINLLDNVEKNKGFRFCLVDEQN